MARVLKRAALCDRRTANLFAVAELLFDRLDTIIAVAATLLHKWLVEILVQDFPAAGGALAVEHHLFEFVVFLFVSFLALLDDPIDFAATKIGVFEFEPRISNFADHISVLQQRQTDATLGFCHT